MNVWLEPTPKNGLPRTLSPWKTFKVTVCGGGTIVELELLELESIPELLELTLPVDELTAPVDELELMIPIGELELELLESEVEDAAELLELALELLLELLIPELLELDELELSATRLIVFPMLARS